MKHRRVMCLVLVVGIAVIGVTVLCFWIGRNSRSSTAESGFVKKWVERPGSAMSSGDPAVVSIRAMGPPAIQSLVAEIEKQHFLLGSRGYSNIFVWLPGWVSMRLPRPVQVEEVRGRAYLTLIVLGPDAWPATPFLARKASLTGRESSLAASALEAIGPPASNAIPQLLEVINGTNRMLVFPCAQALARIDPCNQALISKMVSALGGSDVVSRRGAVLALGNSQETTIQTESQLTGALGDQDVWVRFYAGLALLKAGTRVSRSVAVITNAVNDPAMSSGALISLYHFKPRTPEMVAVMIAACRRFAPWPFGSTYLDSYFEQFDSQDAASVPVLQEALADEKAGIRAKAALALGQIGGPAASALPLLRVAMQDPDEHLRNAASQAVKLIEQRR